MLWDVWVNIWNDAEMVVEVKFYTVVAMSKVDAMHIAEILSGGSARDAVEH